jgi:small subunit ribosomal protein S8
MSHTDPIADMLTRMRNAIMAEKSEVMLPHSKIKLEISKILKKEGYIADFMVDKKFPQSITINLKYGKKNKPVIEGLKRISKPGRRVYANVDHIPTVLGGLGLAVISTSNGIMTGKECKTKRVGGEVLLYIW